MDRLVVIKKFEILNKLIINSKLKTSLKLLTVFGFNGNSVIFATNEDNVYGYGNNRFGCLGLGTFAEDIPEPRLNEALSGKRVANIYYGFGNCIALTSDGKCYAWGDNDFGQLGVGSVQTNHTPQLVKDLLNKIVVEICCGNRNVMALTSDGQVYAWGRNTFGQLADGKYWSDGRPKHVIFKHKISTISLGKCHSLALTTKGQVYLWGLNEFGQCGRRPTADQKANRERAICSRPELIPGYEDRVFTKALCGPNHTLLLTNDGYIYAFGLNDSGQVGKGCSGNQVTPLRIKAETKFKDIVCMFDNDFSIGVSVDNKYFVWGFSYYYKKIDKPWDITDSVRRLGYTVFDVYSEYSRLTKTFKTIVFQDSNDLKTIQSKKKNKKQTKAENSYQMNGMGDEVNAWLIQEPDVPIPTVPNETVVQQNSFKACVERYPESEHQKKIVSILEDFSVDIQPTDSEDPVPLTLANGDVNTGPQIVANNTDVNINDMISSGTEFLKHLCHSFNNESNCDLKFIINRKAIHCHKTIVEIRNEKFWRNVNQYLSEGKGGKGYEIQINGYTYKAFYEFIWFLYGMTPKVNDENCYELLELANTYGERELKELCSRKLQNSVNVRNVCFLFEMSINYCLRELKNSCIDFTSNNWKAVLKTEEFEALDHLIRKQLCDLTLD